MSAPKELKDENEKKGIKDGDIVERGGRKYRVEVVNTKTKVKEHTREHLYQGRRNYDYNKALTALMSRISDDQIEALEEGTLVMDEEKTKAWMSQVKPGDIIGVKHNTHRVGAVRLIDLETEMVARSGKEPEFEPISETGTVTMADLDHARELGLLDILWRDGKPYGEDEFKDMTVYLLHDIEEEGSAPSAPPATGKKKNKKK